MKFLDRLNLRPQERRLVVGIFFVLFVVLNVVFIWPRFGDWEKTTIALHKAEANLAKASNELLQTPTRELKLKELEGAGLFVLPEAQAIALRREVEKHAMQSGVFQNGITSPRASGFNTNQFFEEQSITLGFINTGERELVDFLYNIGLNTSMIRIRDLTVRPDPGQMRLQGTMTLTASYQRKAPKNAQTNSPAMPGNKLTNSVAAAKPAATNATKTGVPPPKAMNPSARPTNSTAAKPATNLTKPLPPTGKPAKKL